MKRIILLCVLLGFITGCASQVGSKVWCERMENKSKGDWSVNEARDYARHCLFD